MEIALPMKLSILPVRCAPFFTRELFRATREILGIAQSVGCDMDGHPQNITDDISSGAVAATLRTAQMTSAVVQWPPPSGQHR
ncbi:60S ribosomal protein L12 [Lemmus lemmus]